MKTIVYDSNNSGGSFWLNDEDWQKLEDAGWKVDWRDERWLGTLATTAKKEFRSVRLAKKEFEDITGQDPDESGCECCGRPHNFYEDYK